MRDAERAGKIVAAILTAMTPTSSEIMALFTELNQRDGITIVLVTHEADIAGYAQRLVRLTDGIIVYDGPVEHAAHHLESTT